MFEIMESIREIYWYFASVSFLFGAAIGSFLNVVIYRLPSEKMSIVKPRSFCPVCKNNIAAYDNIPLLSYIFLRGKCRHCSVKISPRYFLIELVTALFALLYFHLTVQVGFFQPIAAIVYFFFTCALLVVTFVDLDLQIIPNQISLPGIPIGIALSFVMPHSIWDSIIGAALGSGVLLSVAYGYLFIAKKEGMGMGDVKLLAMIGAFLGWPAVPFSLLLASFIGTVVGVVFLLLSGKGREYRIPFGPFLSVGAVGYIFFGPQLIRWYFGG